MNIHLLVCSDKRHSNATIPFWFDEFTDIVDEYSTECSSKKIFIKKQK